MNQVFGGSQPLFLDFDLTRADETKKRTRYFPTMEITNKITRMIF
jgi:hypothetical protein